MNLMSHWSLRTKIVATAAIPFFAFLILCSMSLYTSFSELRQARHGQAQVQTVTRISELVHQLQKERGRSATFLNGAITEAEVTPARAATDEKLLNLTLQSPIQNTLSEIRAKISAKSVSAPEAIKTYTGLIQGLHQEQSAVAGNGELASVKESLRSITILEAAKESAGRLRANVSSILAADKPINEEQFQTVIRVKSGVEVNLNSPGLAVSEKTRGRIREFLSSPQWLRIDAVCQTVLAKSASGAYGEDSKQFFTIITEAIDQMATILQEETAQTQSLINDLNQKALARSGFMLGVLALLAIILAFTVRQVVRAILAPIDGAIQQLSQSSREVAGTSGDLDSSSEAIASAATEAAASLQETAATIEQISAMIRKNAENSEHARSTSDEGQSKVHHGQSIIDQMTRSINEIASSNDQIFSDVKEGNQQISRIVKVISEIGEKTKVINDIVFQTKLLSFNASVEAARAGESGKGFAVVAEEVGNLARMSGKAAEEISRLLESGIREVESIVQNTTGKVESSFKANQQKVQNGVDVSRQCSAVLSEIVSTVGTINQMIMEISTASGEQAAGVTEISKAMSQMDEVTQQNATSATQAATAAKSLSIQSRRLGEVIEGLRLAVNGDRAQRALGRERAFSQEKAGNTPAHGAV